MDSLWGNNTLSTPGNDIRVPSSQRAEGGVFHLRSHENKDSQLFCCSYFIQT